MTSDAISITSSDGGTTATFIPGSNMVCSMLRHAGSDWLDPVRALESIETGKDYGVSLVYPWAGRLAGFGYAAAGRQVTLSPENPLLKLDKQGLPIHGIWDRYLHWDAEKQSEDLLFARLAWTDPRLLEVFPFPHEVSVSASVESARLRLEIELRPTSDAAVPVAFGYHAFLRIPDSARGQWSLALDARDRLLLDERQIPVGDTEPLEGHYGLGELSINDDIGGFELPATLAFTDGRASVDLELVQGFSAAHVFAPSDRDLVSFEPMTAPANALNSGTALAVVEPGDIFRASFAIGLRA